MARAIDIKHELDSPYLFARLLGGERTLPRAAESCDSSSETREPSVSFSDRSAAIPESCAVSSVTRVLSSEFALSKFSLSWRRCASSCCSFLRDETTCGRAWTLTRPAVEAYRDGNTRE